MKQDVESRTIAEIVAENYKAAAVFKKFGLDFCCGGKIPLQEACEKHSLDLKEIVDQLAQITKDNNSSGVAENLRLDALVDYIVDVHHQYVQNSSLEIEPYLEKIVQVHGEKHPELKRVKALFESVKNELAVHMVKEENILFPYIKSMMKAKNNHENLVPPNFKTIINPINMMEQEHVTVGNEFREIRSITNNLTPPVGACNTYCVTFSLLDEFENDLHRHIHLENNILFMKSVSLENELLQAN